MEKNMWKQIAEPRFKYTHRIDENGNVQRYSPGIGWTDVKQNRKLVGENIVRVIQVSWSDGSSSPVRIERLMCGTWIPQKAKRMTYWHKNGDTEDCSAENLELITCKEAERRRANKNRMPVEAIDREGNVLAVYRSIIEASEKEYVGDSVVSRRCRNELKVDPFKFLGHSFRFKEEK